MDIDDFDDIFRRMDKIMKSNLSGGYLYRGGRKEKDDKLDISLDDKHLYITIQFNGAMEEDVFLSLTEDSLYIKVLMPEKEYKRTFTLPIKVKPESMVRTFNNGILDITIERADDGDTLTPEEKQRIENRLRALGYLE